MIEKDTRSCVLPSPLGLLRLTEENGSLRSLMIAGPAAQPFAPGTPLLTEAAAALAAYFAGSLHSFSLPLDPVGTPFQRGVWDVLRTIPWGETAEYGEIAARLENDKASRVVGMACGRNPLPIFIPCHRVVGRGGALTGFAWGLEAKRFLLSLEGQETEGDKIVRSENGLWRG